MLKSIIPIFIVLVFYSCSNGKKSSENDSSNIEVKFEFLDSVVVESLLELYLTDKDPNSERLLLNEKEMSTFFLTDMKGKVLSQFELAGEGPNEVKSPTQVAFWKEGLVVKEVSAEMKYNFFDKDLKKIDQSPVIARSMNMPEMLNSGRQFSLVEKEEKTLIVGHERLAMEADLWTPQEQNGNFYDKAETGFIFEVGSEDLYRLNLYPENWKPKVEKKWVGYTTPFIQVSKTDKVVAILPLYGNQLFYFQLNDNGLTPMSEITLTHPERIEDQSYEINEDSYLLYPYFRRLSAGGQYFLIYFYTAFPRSILDTFKTKGGELYNDPEFQKALKKYYLAKYILTDTKGNQAAIAELPIPGEVHFMDADDIIYIKPTSETEKDYNVFYRYRVSFE
ncbi:hypothetical protein Q4534_01615 [Cyclobacterium sp. 1_MG-2023]|uniref:hypothetical protein n=1 Tax=Cyclobacterium sp. 1_MG-2023 TaxID=3062681 RepID=UPI0026E438C6|nr:hypothetical protein [Cyclobacterium sp. 1_MG-2023]MDO6436079.1 hypothetical protein [Cyclobacterium sp. 1_MG-2023]